MSLVGLALGASVRDRARELGFDRVTIGPAGPPARARAFEAWLAAGYAGSMDYLERGRAERLEPERLLAGCRSVITVALSYARPGRERGWAGVARYARGRDYHEVMRPRLLALADFVREAAGDGVACRAAVDTSAILERDVAARAGLGWVGKNTNLLASGLGSYFFIGMVLTTAALEPDAEQPDRCGTCTACLDACPTGAFPAPYVLDARRCIAYLTIEHRGDIAEELRAGVGEWLFGCDVCQEVCPWNRKVPPAREAAPAPAGPLGEPEELLALDADAFRARFRHTPLWRARRAGLLRNAAIVLGNRGDARSAPALARALDDPEEPVRHAAAWALARLRGEREAAP